ncbi:Galactan beta-1,4-galactosyltransferase GALS1-like protein [Drosera capensis]
MRKAKDSTAAAAAAVPGNAAAAAVGKMSVCFETKPVVATLLAVTLVMAIWNLQPYYENLISTSCRCSFSRLSTSQDFANQTITMISSSSSSSSSVQLIAEAKNAQIPASSVKTTVSADPNKREFKAYGNAAALFVQMGAYRGGPATFAVVGLASKPTHVYGKPWYKCEWVSSNGTSVKTKAYKMLPDWGYGRVYTVVVVNCTFVSGNPNSDNSGGKLVLYAYYGPSSRRYERFVSLEEKPGEYDPSRYSPPYKYDYLYCGSSLYGDLSAARIREWMAYHVWFFGPRSHFVFHDAGGVSEEVRKVLEPWVRAGRATVQDIRAQEEFDGYYYNQFLVVNDCLHRYKFAANWTFYFDVDEYIYLPDGRSLEAVLDELKEFTQFTIEQYAMSSELCLNDSTRDYSREWGFEKLLFRDSRTKIWRDRKYAIQAKNAYATGVHMSENVVGKSTHKTENKIRYYHYHNSITVKGEPCRVFLPPSAMQGTTWHDKLPFVYEDSMKKLAPTIKQFEQQTLGAVHQEPST